MENIIEGNFLIAQFMGYDYPNRGDECWKVSVSDLHNYNDDWRLLMPVVEKIEKDFDEMSIVVKNTRCKIYQYKDSMAEKAITDLVISETKIGAVWQSVISFITWYNQTKP